MQNLTIVYDGKCPLCSNCCRHLKLEESLGPVDLVDARQSGTVRQQLSNQHYDLDQGMVVLSKSKTYFGADAIHFLAQVNNRSDGFNRLFFLFFISKRVSSALYPALRAGRNFLLWVMHVPQINNLKRESDNG